MNNYSNISNIIQSNIILISIIIFVVVFIIINYEKVVSGQTTNLNVGNPILISLVIILILYLLTMDDDKLYKEEKLEIPKFRLNDVNNNLENMKGGNKYKVANNLYSNMNDYENKNIFISQKYIGKYGIKF
jgi:hypothetical protein